jgi:hypothetical protein
MNGGYMKKLFLICFGLFAALGFEVAGAQVIQPSLLLPSLPPAARIPSNFTHAEFCDITFGISFHCFYLWGYDFYSPVNGRYLFTHFDLQEQGVYVDSMYFARYLTCDFPKSPLTGSKSSASIPPTELKSPGDCAQYGGYRAVFDPATGSWTYENYEFPASVWIEATWLHPDVVSQTVSSVATTVDSTGVKSHSNCKRIDGGGAMGGGFSISGDFLPFGFSGDPNGQYRTGSGSYWFTNCTNVGP